MICMYCLVLCSDLMVKEDIDLTREIRTSRSYLIHLKRSKNCLNQYGPSNCTARHLNIILCHAEHVIPQSGLEVGLHLGQVKVRASAPLYELPGIVEKVKAKVEQASRNGFAVDGEMDLFEMPTSSSAN